MDLSDLSFFQHKDFKFADDSSMSSGLDNETQNSIKLVIDTKEVVQGDCLIGFIHIEIGERLPEGQIRVKLESFMDIKFNTYFGKNINSIVTDYKDILTNDHKKKRKLIQNRVGLVKRILVDNEFNRGKYRVTQNHQISRKFSIFNMNSQSQNRRYFAKNLVKPSIKRFQSVANKIINTREQNLDKRSLLEEEEIVLKKRMRKIVFAENLRTSSTEITIFTLRQDIKEKTSLSIPFRICISDDHPISYRHLLNINSKVDLIEMKKIEDIELFTSRMNKKKLSQLNEESVELKHVLTATFVSNRSTGNKSPMQKQKDNIDISIDKLGGSKYFLEHSINIRVLSKQTSSDFKRYVNKIVLDIPSPVLSVVENFFCCCFLKKSQKQSLRQVARNFFQIGIDKLVYRTNDHSINCVFKFHNQILKFYDYLDIMIVVHYVIGEEDIKQKLQETTPGTIILDGAHCGKESGLKNTCSLQMKNFDILADEAVEISNEDTSGNEPDDKIKSFDVIIHIESVDLLGKRILDLESETEMVHCIPIEQNKVATSLETVETDLIKISYSLDFYLSSGALTLTKMIKKIPLIFHQLPDDYKKHTKQTLHSMLHFLERKIDDKKNSVILPFTSIEFC